MTFLGSDSTFHREKIDVSNERKVGPLGTKKRGEDREQLSEELAFKF